MSKEVGATPLGNLFMVLLIMGCFLSGAYFLSPQTFKDLYAKYISKNDIATEKKDSKSELQQKMSEAVKKAEELKSNSSQQKSNMSYSNKQQSSSGRKKTSFNVEAPDSEKITSVREYSIVPSQVLPPVKGTSGYKFDKNDPTVVFTINVWGGWLPLIAYNKGFEPNTESMFYKKYGFKVKLKIIDDQVAARDYFASGEAHTLWGTLDTIALFAYDLLKDSRTAPRVYQLMDWSHGSDGIVVRGNIKSISDLAGKKVVYAQNSSSQYFLSAMLMNAELSFNSVKHVYTSTPFEAAAAFVADKSIDACVSWAPDIYNIPHSVAKTRVLTTTNDANRLIANCWAVRADFARDNPAIVRGLVSGIFEGLEIIQNNNSARNEAMLKMAEGFGMNQNSVALMCSYYSGANCADNNEFFVNMNNPTNFERTWQNINAVYGLLGKISKPINFASVGNSEAVKALYKSERFKNQRPTSNNIAAVSYKRFGKSPILTQVVRINFYPNSDNVFEPDHDINGNPIEGTLYDPSAEAVIEKIARLAGQFSTSKLFVVGHTDMSMRGKPNSESEAKELSLARAKAVCQALVDKYGFEYSKFSVSGKGWSEPFNTKKPYDHTMNRRVEVRIYAKEPKSDY